MAKGLIQEDLVAKCNINVRILQRIEAGQVILPKLHIAIYSLGFGSRLFRICKAGKFQKQNARQLGVRT